LWIEADRDDPVVIENRALDQSRLGQQCADDGGFIQVGAGGFVESAPGGTAAVDQRLPAQGPYPESQLVFAETIDADVVVAIGDRV